MRKDSISLVIEFILFIALIVSTIISIISKNYVILKLLIGVTLLIMSYNNQKYFKRKYLTYIDLIVGLLLIIVAIYEVFNG